MEERCICCGSVIPEGRQVCPNCESTKPILMAIKRGEDGRVYSQKPIATCGQCEHAARLNDNLMRCTHPEHTGGTHSPEWFCADGELRKGTIDKMPLLPKFYIDT